LAGINPAFILGGFMSLLKVKPWGEGQGDFVFIEEADFDPEFHVKFEEAEEAEKPKGKK
jgi:hypothetical protein